METTLTEHCPAKVNLMLGVTGRRPDGFHDLISVVGRVEHGDTLTAQWRAQGEDTLTIAGAHPVPTADNTVSRAIAAYRRVAGPLAGALQFTLEKRIPSGAGLGGGSSDGVAALRACQRVWRALEPAQLSALAAELGSDCPLFLAEGGVVMRGRGERLAAVPVPAWAQWAGRPIYLFKPSFGIATPEAYRRLAARRCYADASALEAQLAEWMAGQAPLRYANSFETLLATWMPTFAVLLDTLRASGRYPMLGLSGSGSACFAVLETDEDDPWLQAQVCAAWGADAWIQRTRIT